MVLQVNEGCKLIVHQSNKVLNLLECLTDAHAETDIIARTNGQYAHPITLGTKFRVWIAELNRRHQAITDALGRGLMVQFGGPVGDLRSFDPEIGSSLKTEIAGFLGLGHCNPHWQSARDGIAEIITAIGLLCTSLEKIAKNVNVLSSSDIGELREAYEPGKGGSSAMAHKANQRSSEFAEAVARLARQRSLDIHDSCLHEHERSGGAWIAEWVTVPQVFLLASGALMWTERLFDTLVINKIAMRQNLEKYKNQVNRAKLPLDA